MNEMPNNLHKLVPPEIRAKVEEALANPRPGLATYEQVHRAFDLDPYGVSIKTVERYGLQLRREAREARIDRLRALHQVSEAILGTDDGRIDEAAEKLLYAKLLERAADEASAGELLKLSAAIHNSVSARVKRALENQRLADRAKLANDLAKVGEVRGLTPEVLAEIKAKVLGV